MEELRIDLDSPHGVYFPGQVISGSVYIRLKDSIKARSVVVSILGKARTQWTHYEPTRTSPGLHMNRHGGMSRDRTHARTISYWSEVVYLDQQCAVWQPPPNCNHLPAGEHRFAFSFIIPPVAPPTFEGSVGFIRYSLKTKIDRPWHIDNVQRRAFSVTPHFDLNTIPYCACPVVSQMNQELGSLWFKHGKVDAKIHLPKSGYVPGESISLRLDIDNQATRDVVRIKTSLIQSAICSAKRHDTYFNSFTRHNEVDTKEETRTVVQYLEKFEVPKHSSGSYQRQLAIPPVVPSFNVCPIIQVGYYLKIKLVAKGSIKNSITREIPLLLGTIPVRVPAPPQPADFQPQPLAPPLPSAPPDYESTVNLQYGDSVFKGGNLADDSSEKGFDYTPKYVFYGGTS